MAEPPVPLRKYRIQPEARAPRVPPPGWRKPDPMDRIAAALEYQADLMEVIGDTLERIAEFLIGGENDAQPPAA